MSAQSIHRSVLYCDGCKTRLVGEHASAVEARAVAYLEGWRFLPRVNADGATSLETDDVCPNCLDGWQPQAAQRGRGKRA